MEIKFIYQCFSSLYCLPPSLPLPLFFAFQKEVKERMEEGRKGGGKEGKRGNENENEKGEIKEKDKSLL